MKGTQMTEESNLVTHARRELALIGEDPYMTEAIVACVKVFSEQDHSGSSAAYAIGRLSQLLRFEPLTPLTRDPREWMLIEEDMAGQPGLYQNRRDGRAFSHDHGHSYYLVDDPQRVMHEAEPMT